MEQEIIYVDSGLANYYEDRIEINKRIKDDDQLLQYVLKHERGHKNHFDVWHEFDFSPQTFRLMWFVLKNPSTWIDFSPFQYRNKQLIYDLNLISLYALLIISSFVFYKIFF